MAELSISAIICTHNRDQYLGAAIDSLLAQTLQNIEVIVKRLGQQTIDGCTQILIAIVGANNGRNG